MRTLSRTRAVPSGYPVVHRSIQDSGHSIIGLSGTGAKNLSVVYLDALHDQDDLLLIRDSELFSEAPASLNSSTSWWPHDDDELVQIVQSDVALSSSVGPETPATPPVVVDLVRTAVKSPAQITEDVLRGFSLTKTQLASILGVSRQSVHSWLRGAHDLGSANQERLTQLDHLLQALSSAGVSRPDIALTCPLFPDRTTAADRVRSGKWDEIGDSRFLLDQMLHRPVESSPDANHVRAITEIEAQARFLVRDE